MDLKKRLVYCVLSRCAEQWLLYLKHSCRHIIHKDLIDKIPKISEDYNIFLAGVISDCFEKIY